MKAEMKKNICRQPDAIAFAIDDNHRRMLKFAMKRSL